jgi:FkbM family methyltransferase
MLIPFKDLFEKYNINAKGVLHIGASTGQECAHYYANGIERTIWIEAIPDVFNELVKHIEPYPDAIAINACISDEDGKEVDFNISSNRGESSSFLPLGTHAIVHPDVSYISQIKCHTKRIDSIFKEMDFDIKNYTFLNIDLQGAELFALRSMGELLDSVDYAYLEVNKDYLYVGCSLIGEIDEYMQKFGFVLVETEWAGNTGWGDCFMIKKHLLPKIFE